MKFTDEKFPVLRWLKDGKLGRFGISESDAKQLGMEFFTEDVNVFFKDHVNQFRSNIKYISTTLSDSVFQGAKKLAETKELINMSSCSGTILLPNVTQYCYFINMKADEDSMAYGFLEFQGDNLVSVVYDDGLGNGSLRYYSSKFTKIPGISWIHKQVIKEKTDQSIQTLFMICGFLEFAELEIRTVQPNRTINDDIKAVYNNKSRYPIQVIDSRWFTTIVRTEGFAVRGHFRLQPYGTEGKRKLIWISDFRKNGYTRIADKLRTSLNNTFYEG